MEDTKKPPMGENPEEFLQDLRQYPRLTPEQERELALRCAQGDPEALAKMVSHNLRLVVSLAREYAGRGVPLMDLIQEGSIGLMVAARKFDPGLDYRFSTYASKWIRQGITRCLMDHAGLIRVPTHTAERMRQLLRLRSAFVQEHGVEPDTEQLSREAGLPRERVEKLLRLIPEVCSLDAPAGDEETLGQLLPDAARSPQDILVQTQLLELLDGLVAQLDPRQQTILRLHYGMEDGVCHSLEEISETLGISKERTRQVEKQAFDRIKALGADLGLEDFLEE